MPSLSTVGEQGELGPGSWGSGGMSRAGGGPLGYLLMTGQLCLHHPHSLRSPLPQGESQKSLRLLRAGGLPKVHAGREQCPTLPLFESHLHKFMALLHYADYLDAHC